MSKQLSNQEAVDLTVKFHKIFFIFGLSIALFLIASASYASPVNPPAELMNGDWKTQILSIITNPTIAYLLILLGIYGVFFELVNPGYIFPGVIGGVSMIVALYALQSLPVNYVAFALIILGMLFIIAEAFTPSFGALGAGGTAAFIIGSIMLINSEQPSYQIAWPAICAMTFLNIFIFVFLLGMLIKSRRQKIKNGLVMLIGAKGRALGEINQQGQAIIRGEIWSVQSKKHIPADKNIKVISAEGLVLEIEEDLSPE